MKRMHPPGYHHNGFVATHALGHRMYRRVPKCMMVITGRAHCFHDYVHLTSVKFEQSVCRGLDHL